MNETFKKGTQKNAVARLREFYNTVIRRPLTEQEKEKLRDVFKKENTSEEPKADSSKKIAKPEQDAGLV